MYGNRYEAADAKRSPICYRRLVAPALLSGKIGSESQRYNILTRIDKKTQIYDYIK